MRPRARDGPSVSLVQDFAEKALVPKLDSCVNHLALFQAHPETFCTFIFHLQSNLKLLSRGAVRSAASSYAAMCTVAGSLPVLVTV